MVEYKISHRKTILNTGALLFVMGALCTIAMFYTVNRNGFALHAPFTPLHDAFRGDVPSNFRFTQDTVISTEAVIPQPKPEVVKSGVIRDLVNKIELTNVTKPLFTLFPVDQHIQSFASYFTRRNTTVTHLPTSYTLDARIDCNQDSTALLILVPSVVKDAKIRQDIRSTWASELYGSNLLQTDIAKVVFFFGDASLKDEQKEFLKSESEKFGDIVTIDMQDSYRNLSLKIAAMLRWSSDKCPSAQFVAKLDVDTWLNVPLLIKLLHNLTEFNRQNNITASTIGFRHAYNLPIAVHSGKWEIPISVYPYNFLPRYVYGHSYVLSRRAVDNVVSTLPFFPIIPNEDAFITGIMSLVSNVTRVHSPAFAHLFKKQTYQDIQNNRFVSSIYSKKNLTGIWKELASRNASVNGI